MAFLDRVLSDDEQLIRHLHPHWKSLIVPVALVPVIVGVAAFAAALAPDGSASGPVRLGVLALAVVALAWFSVLPWLRWRTTHFIITSQRIIFRTGVLSRSGRTIPLARVNDVTFRHSLIERMLRCGTLIIESGGERGQLVLPEVPEVEDVQRELAGLVEDSLDGRGDTPDPDRRSHA